MNNYNWRLAFLVCVLLSSSNVYAAKISNVKASKHNLSATYPTTPDPRTVKADATTGEKQICVFCHTPHASIKTGAAAKAPLWNHKLSAVTTYSTYRSDSLDAIAPDQITVNQLDQPDAGSKLCLSCHDGTIAIGSVNVANGKGVQTIALTGVPTSGVMPAGSGDTTGFTAKLGVDLTNDHPISVYYTNALSLRDGELRVVNAISQQATSGSTTIVAPRLDGSQPLLPLSGKAPSATVQCITCHDPHLVETDPTLLSTYGNQKFLRLNRFQTAQPTATFTKANDIICLGCHVKGLAGTTGVEGVSWAYSVHANSQVKNGATDYTYTTTAATQRDFPTSLPVWQAACLNCHDTHTIQGASRLLREGTDSTAIPKTGGNQAQEETCYQCHANSRAGTPSVVNAAGVVPQDIYKDFTKTIHMPIVTADQGLGGGSNLTEVHDIGTGSSALPNFDPVNDSTSGNTLGSDCAATSATTTNKCGADFMEPRTKLGANSKLNNRHVECTDCHNPHRMARFQNAFPALLSSIDPSGKGTHKHTDDTTTPFHTNVISGVLRGTFGVEPQYLNGASFFTPPSGYAVKRGDPGTATGITDCAGTNKTNCDNQTYVTREYQICLKCHSDYAYDDNNLADVDSNRPVLGRSGLTPSGANGLTRYSSVAREMQAPSTHRGEPGGLLAADSGAFKGTNPAGLVVDFQTNNHRSWKPVLDSTGRTTAIRGATASMWNLPWGTDASIGNQTMYCSDCHGSDTTGYTAIPSAGENWGPHGSQHNFLLKGPLDRCTGTDDNHFTSCVAGLSAIEKNERTATGTAGSSKEDLCFKCHSYADYTGGNSGKTSGFSNSTKSNLHDLHNTKTGHVRCTWCHIAVTHGWKNKAFLVNLNDVGPEVTCRTEDKEDGVCTLAQVGSPMPAGSQARNGPLPQPGGSTDPNYWQNNGYTNPPYYLNAMVKIINFKPSGQWFDTDVGSVGAPGNGLSGSCGAGGGGGWMGAAASSENCTSPP